MKIPAAFFCWICPWPAIDNQLNKPLTTYTPSFWTPMGQQGWWLRCPLMSSWFSELWDPWSSEYSIYLLNHRERTFFYDKIHWIDYFLGVLLGYNHSIGLDNSDSFGNFKLIKSTNYFVLQVSGIDLYHGAAILNFSHWYQYYQPTEAGRIK